MNDVDDAERSLIAIKLLISWTNHLEELLTMFFQLERRQNFMNIQRIE